MRYYNCLLLSFSFLFIFVSCKKDEDPIAALKQKLTDNSTKVWKLSKLFVNGSQQTLTPGQLSYTKTFNTNGNWSDSDGYSGTFKIETTKLLKETTTVGGSGIVSYKINALADNQLDVEYTIGQETYRLVYAP
jgi:hypothetical protein